MKIEEKLIKINQKLKNDNENMKAKYEKNNLVPE